MGNGITTCSTCGCEEDKSDYEFDREDEYGDLICDDCFEEEYMNYCQICEELFEKPTTAKDTFFIVTKEQESIAGITAGVYQALEYPFFYGNILSGFDAFFKDSIKLIRECDINSMIRKINGHGEVQTDICCPDCAERFSAKKYRYINYWDKKLRVHQNINVRSIISQGY
jgi:hypothetical protein